MAERRTSLPRGPGAPALEELARDRRRGAQALALDALDRLDRAVSSAARGPRVRPAIRELATELGRLQPAMSPFAEWSRSWSEFARSGSDATALRRTRAWARRWRVRLRSEPAGIARTVSRNLPPHARLVTLSRSATVTDALTSLSRPRRPRSVTVLESRPGGEGRAMAAGLRATGIRASWTLDRRRERALDRADLVVIGADSISTHGDVVHKVGTRELAKAARRRGVPIVVVSGRSKWRTRGRAPRSLPALFDRTPGSWIDAYWTETGVRRGRSSRRRQLYRRRGRTRRS